MCLPIDLRFKLKSKSIQSQFEAGSQGLHLVQKI
jgi:hypothetical protein